MSTRVPVPFTGRHIEVPVAPDSLAFDVAIGVLAVAEMIEWPVGLMLIAGHWLTSRRSSSRVEAAIGEAFEEVA